VLVRNFEVHWVNVSESSGARSPRSQIKGH